MQQKTPTLLGAVMHRCLWHCCRSTGRPCRRLQEVLSIQKTHRTCLQFPLSATRGLAHDSTQSCQNSELRLLGKGEWELVIPWTCHEPTPHKLTLRQPNSGKHRQHAQALPTSHPDRQGSIGELRQIQAKRTAGIWQQIIYK